MSHFWGNLMRKEFMLMSLSLCISCFPVPGMELIPPVTWRNVNISHHCLAIPIECIEFRVRVICLE